jgi:ankyrin repeat protein
LAKTSVPADVRKAAGKRLAAAVNAQDLEAVERELNAGKTPVAAADMVHAAGLGWRPGLALLAKHGGDLNASHRNYRPLHALIQEKPHAGGSSTPKRVACLKWMLAHGADPDLTGAWPLMRALIVAAFTGERDYVSTLIEGGARPGFFGDAALGDARRVEAALARDQTLALARDAGGVTALHCCAGSRLGCREPKVADGLLEVATLLIGAGANVNETVRSWGHDVDVMYFAIGQADTGMITLLLDSGADATAALPSAAWRSDFDVCDLLIARGARIDDARDGDRPILNELIRWGQFKPAMWLLSKGANPNVPDARGWTALHQAASRGNVRMLRTVLDAGGDRNRRDAQGVTPADIGIPRRVK